MSFHTLLSKTVILLGALNAAVVTSTAVSPAVPTMRYVYVFLMASWGALAALLQVLASRPPGKRWRWSVARDFVNANLAALLTFWACQHFGVQPPMDSIALTLAGYGGAKFMEAIYRKFLGKVLPEVSK